MPRVLPFRPGLVAVGEVTGHSPDPPVLVRVDAGMLDRIFDTTEPFAHEGLGREAGARFEAARSQTAWAVAHRQRFALTHGNDILATAERHHLTGVLDRQAISICGIGGVHVHPGIGHGNYALTLVERMLEAAEQEGMDLALLFAGSDHSYVPSGFDAIPAVEVELDVAEPPRRGAPMTLVREGDDRDLPAIVAMGQVRAGPFRFRADRDVDLVKHAITQKRLLAGFTASGTRQLRFVIAEEGITAAAYVVVSIVGRIWTIEECGDRDASGARVGALLQALIARDPAEARPIIRGWLPSGFVPPQVTLRPAGARPEVMMIRALRSTCVVPRLTADDVVWWTSDVF